MTSSSSSSSSPPSSLTAAQRNLLSYFTPSNNTLFHGDEGPATTAYYDALTHPFPAVGIKYINAVRGKAVVATRDVGEGEVVFTDAPILAMRDFDSEATILICETCYTPLGTPATQLAHILDRAPTAAELALVSSDVEPPPPTTTTGDADHDFIHCECGTAAFCSTECQSGAPHRLLCPADASRDTSAAALAAFKHHAAHTNDVFYLALVFYARVKADIKHALVTSSSSSTSSPSPSSPTTTIHSTIPQALRTALAPFRLIAKRFWWDVLQPLPTDEDYEPPESFRAQLEQVLQESLVLLRNVVIGKSEEADTTAAAVRTMMDDILNTEFYALVVGMFEMNILGAEIESPLTDRLDDNNNPELATLVRDALISSSTTTDDSHHDHDNDDNHDSNDSDSENDTPPPLQADLALLFPLHSVLNHSCTPNAVVGFSHGRATITAVRAIKAGAEVCADYVHGEQGGARREAIRKWGSEMVCPVGECVVCDAEDVDEDDEDEEDEDVSP
ncbi:hypothetical protein BDZ88DRAFT_421883 [Geranomyces variabilis]|nr:hypothetical protein BDZ88DRAFT_421883 [Geranomyces variabilis]KAJ3140971.1 hypothetical protein HDU90_006992 [Geranomyces variabilis]